MYLKSNLTNREITHDTVMKKASPPPLPTFERGGGNAPLFSCSLASLVPFQQTVKLYTKSLYQHYPFTSDRLSEIRVDLFDSFAWVRT